MLDPNGFHGFRQTDRGYHLSDILWKCVPRDKAIWGIGSCRWNTKDRMVGCSVGFDSFAEPALSTQPPGTRRFSLLYPSFPGYGYGSDLSSGIVFSALHQDRSGHGYLGRRFDCCDALIPTFCHPVAAC